MKTNRNLLAGLVGLTAMATAVLAGQDTWRRPVPQKPAAPRQCCAGHMAVCAPGGTCCDVKHAFIVPGSGRGVIQNNTVICRNTCAMPVNERACCATGCLH